VLSTDKVLDPGSYCVACVATVTATGVATGVACRRRGGVPSDEDADEESNESILTKQDTSRVSKPFKK
jgi:hypothetical protein